MAEPLEEQKKILRGILIHKHSPKVTGTKRISSKASGTGSRSSSNNDSAITRMRSPQSMLMRVLQTASKAATSPKQSLSRKVVLPSKPQPDAEVAVVRATATTTTATAVPKAPPDAIPPNQPPSSSSLREQMRQRLHVFPKKQQQHAVTTIAAATKETSTATSSSGYEAFVQSLMNEVSSHHSELYASFVVALDTTAQTRDEVLQECQRSSPKNSRRDTIVDAGVIKKLHGHLQQQQHLMVRPATQLMNDKHYYSQQQKKKKKTKRSSESIPPTDQTTIPAANINHTIPNNIEPPPKLEMVPKFEDEVFNSRSMDSDTNTDSARAPTNVKTKKSFLSVEIPKSHSSDSTTVCTNDTSPTTTSSTMVETLESSPTIGNDNKVPKNAIHNTELTTWNRTQLKTVTSNDSHDTTAKSTASHYTAPEWANITLRPVSSRSDTGSSNVQSVFPLHNTKMETCEKLTMDEIMETENVTMIRLKDEIINCCDDDDGKGNTGIESRVVIGETLIRHIQYDAVDMTAPVTVLWTLPRHEMEPDGITINMSTFKITLLLRNHRLSRKILSFENSEDCLRFATAFYNMAVVAPPPLERPELDRTTTTNTATAETIPVVPVVEPMMRTEQPTLNLEEQVVLEKYRELRLTKQATDALQETMALQQSKYTDRAIEPKNGALPSDVDMGSLPTSPVSTFTATTTGVDNMTTTASSDPQWTDEEQKTIEKYQLMLRRGVPSDAVRHKMTLEQVEERIVSFVLANDDKVSPENGASGHNRIAKTQDSALSLEETATAEKYRKMLKLRIPIDAVQHKMIQDQVEAKIIAAVLGQEYMPKNEEPNKSTKAKTSTALSEEEESVAVQYRKLLKINVSKDALLARMKQEGVSPKIIIAILGQNALTLPSGDDNGKAGSSSGSTGSKMISINWDHTENAIAGSVWEVWQNAEPEPMDFSQLKQMFQRKEQKQKDMKTIDATNGIGKAKLLDITRANNIAISLKAFKEFTHSELAEIIQFLDPIRKIRGERTIFIRDLLPTLTEVKIIDEYNGPDDRLVPAEVWFRHLRGIQRIERKARVIRTMEMFTADAVEVRDNFRLLADVCRQVMASTKLQDVLGMVLRIGNVMNEGTRNGRAAGFKFNSLLRLTQTKTADGKITVLDYLVSVFVEKGETDTLDLLSDFPDCHKASRFLISDMSNEVKALKESLEQCKLELADLERELNPPPSLKQPTKADDVAAAINPHSLLFASILARAGGCSTTDDSLPTTRKSTESFAKRDEFLAAVKSKNVENHKEQPDPVKDQSDNDDEKRNDELTTTTFENTLSGGMLRLRKFIEVVEVSFTRLEKTRVDTLAACKDLSRYCGESGGVGVTISLLDVLSQFTRNLDDAVKKYQDQILNDARKQRIQEAKEINAKSDENESSASKIDGKSIVVIVNDLLKNSNPRFKEDFKKGRVVENPSESLKAVYERERKGSAIGNLRLDIVSAIQQREEKVNFEEIEKARSAFAGVQALLDDSSPRELTIDQISSFPFSNSDSHSECTMSNDGRSIAMDPNDADKNHNTAAASKENVQNATPKETDNGDTKLHSFMFDIQSSQDRLRSRQSLSPSKVNSSSLADVMKNLEEIKKQSPTKKMQPQRIKNDIPPRSVERKSISERAREKRSEKRPNGGIGLFVPAAMTPPIIPESTDPIVPTSLEARSPTIMMLNRQRRLTSVIDADENNTDSCHEDIVAELPAVVEEMKGSSFARLARQKRIQKRMTK